MSFKERLIFLRKLNKLTQKEISIAIGISELGYQRYEYGTREPAFKILIALADYFDVSIDYLVGRTNNPKINNEPFISSPGYQSSCSDEAHVSDVKK